MPSFEAQGCDALSSGNAVVGTSVTLRETRSVRSALASLMGGQWAGGQDGDENKSEASAPNSL